MPTNAQQHNPILRVAQSDQDYRQPEGGGGGGAKEIVEVTQALRDNLHGKLLTARSTLSAGLQQWPNLPGVAKLVLREQALAKSHRPLHLLSRAEIPMIGAAGLGQLLLSVTTRTLTLLDEQITTANTKAARANISTIDDVLPYGIHDRLGGESGWGIRDLSEWLQAGRTLKAELFRHGADEIDSALEQQFAAWAAELGASLTRLDYLTPQKLYSVTTTHHDLLEKLLQFPGLRTLAPMPIYVAEDIGSQAVEIGNADPNTAPAPDSQTNYPLVGIIDTGIDPKHPMLSAWVAARESYIMPPETDFVHGTFVGGLLAAARSLNFGDAAFPDLRAKILDVCALEITGALETDLHARILEVVRRHLDVKVWNLSLGGRVPGPTDRFSDFAQMLDALSDETGCLFVIAAGNYVTKPFRTIPPQPHIGDDDRISIPAESVRGLSVGSLAHLDVAHSAVKRGQPSPFSRRGPGPVSIPKPEVVHLGGNCSLIGDPTYTALRSLLPNGKLGEDIGTSFAAPLVALLAAHTWNSVESAGGIAYPELVKALLIHSAVLRSPERGGDALHYYGFGQPGDEAEALYCDPHTFTLMFEADVRDGMEFEKFPYPIPACLRTDDGRFRGEILITMCYSPPLNGQHGVEYCRANVDLSFGSYDLWPDGKRHQRGVVPLEPGDKNQLYEAKQIEHGFKWSPTKVYRARFPKGIAAKDWRLKLDVLRRAGEGVPDQPQRVVALVTLRGLDSDQPVYADGVRAINTVGWSVRAMSQAIQVST
ncbi:MAG: S8 family peptidase [Rugosibacter sp.]|nr:MAG: S8 family peptidase [Rugosibacter sp.]TBR09921.1 MAG: S8 family peptidase [Rugosibacter sp.]